MLAEAQVVAAEIERVNPTVPTMFDRDDTFYSQIEKRKVETISARDMRIPLELRPGGKFGHFDPDGGDLGLGDGPTFDKALINTVHIKFAVQWTKKAEWATDDSRKSVVNTFKHLMSKAMPEFRRNVDSLCMTDGTGVLATITNVVNGGGNDTYTLDNNYGARLLRFGQDVHVYSANLGTQRTTGVGVTITSIDYVNKTIVVPQVTSSAATDKIVISGVSGANPVSLLGVPYHHNNASTGTWLGFNRATTPEIRANRVNANSSALALPFSRLAINKIGDRVGIDVKKKVEAWMHPAQAQAYEELGQLVSIINKTPSSNEKMDLYFGDNMQIAGAPVKQDYSWNRSRIDFISREDWGRAEMHPAAFYDVGGKKLFEIRGASGGVATSQVMYLTASFNLFLMNPAIGSYIDTLAIPTGY